MIADILHPSELKDADRRAWRSMIAATPAFSSPLLSPEFTEAVGAVREDARIAVWRDDRGPIGFLPHHARPMGFARPIGAPFCDYHALVRRSDAAFDLGEALGAADISALRLNGLIDPFDDFEDSPGAMESGQRIVVGPSTTAYFDTLKAASSNRFKNFRRYTRKLEADVGETRLAAPDRDPAAFERLLGWKRDQIRRTGVHDFLHMPWAQALMQSLFGARDAGLQGLMINFYAGERHVAGHFGVRMGGHYHPWIGAADPAFDAYSPGLLHLWRAIEAMPGLGLHTYDLGPSLDHWKRRFANEEVAVRRGLAPACSRAGRLAASCEKVWDLPGLGRIGAVGRLRNRLDQIAAMELTVGGRVQGVIGAFAGYERRRASRAPADVPSVPL